MRVLHIIDSGGLYGAEVMLLNLMAEQVAMGLKPVVASIGEKKILEKPFEAEAIQRGFQVKKFRMVPGPNLKGAMEIVSYVRRHRFDILHSHGYKGNILLGFIPKTIRRLPLVSTLHGYTSTSGWSKMRVYEWLDLVSHGFMDQVVIVNKGMLAHPKFKDKRRCRHYHVIDNGIPLVTNEPVNSSNLNQKGLAHFCKDRFVIGSIGRLSSEKGYQYLIDAFARVVEKGLDVYLVIVGEGYLEVELKTRVQRLGLSNRVMFPGYLNSASASMSFFSVYVISSLTEGLPITLLEAMRAKVPVVATVVGGIPEVLDNGRGGELVPSCDIDALAAAMTSIYNHGDEARSKAEYAYRRLVNDYSSRQMAVKYLTLYKQTIGV